jgi:NAD(P)H-flavin reductase
VLRKEWDDLAAKNPDRLSVKYVLDKEPRGWKGKSLSLDIPTITDALGETGFVTPDMLSRLFPKGDDKVRAFVCGPPPQVKSIAGPKDGPRQGELQGALKELGYTADEVFKY